MSQLNWFRNIVQNIERGNSTLALNWPQKNMQNIDREKSTGALNRHPSDQSTSIAGGSGESPAPQAIVLMQCRSKDRCVMVNFTSIRRTLESLASFLHLKFYFHVVTPDSMINRFKLFTNASIVVAPHGAGGIFLNSAPSDACFVEILPHGDTRDALAFSRLAYLRGQDYFGLASESSTSPMVANMTKLVSAIRSCILRDKVFSTTRTSLLDRILQRLLNP